MQTFYVEAPIANLLFATADPTEVYFPEHSLIVGADGSMRSTIAMSPGTVYTVVSSDTTVAPSVLAKIAPITSRTARGRTGSGPPAPARALREGGRSRAPDRDRGARHERPTRRWQRSRPGWGAMSATPPISRHFFRARTPSINSCSAPVSATASRSRPRSRSCCAPSACRHGRRSATFPGPFDPLSDLYEIQAKDAHAWVQVWFPGVGWQSFDPTAQVPLAPPDPGAVLLADIGHGIARLPWAPIGSVLGAVGLFLLAVLDLRRRRGRPRLWVDRVTAELEKRGAAAGVPRMAAETLDEYASRLTKSGRWQSGAGSPGQLVSATAQLERIAYGGQEPDAPTRALVEAIVRSLRPALGLRRRGRAHRLTQP